jgi:hypothetical protein
MGRGGARANAGAKSKWNNSETTTIRVPAKLVDKILDYAKKLDSEEVLENGTNSKVINLSNISVRFNAGKPIIYLEEFLKSGYEILPERLSIQVEASIRKNLNTPSPKKV